MHWLQNQPWIDPKRIGVFGWSYGGFMTLMLLAKGSDVIAAGAAVAPVTDWRLYDTGYTERYLGTPKNNGQGYANSAVLSALAGLKSPPVPGARHGRRQCAVRQFDRPHVGIAKSGRAVRVDDLSGAKHGLSTPQMKKHVYTAIQEFFDRHVKDAH